LDSLSDLQSVSDADDEIEYAGSENWDSILAGEEESRDERDCTNYGLVIDGISQRSNDDELDSGAALSAASNVNEKKQNPPCSMTLALDA
jgi:hypothetical protein